MRILFLALDVNVDLNRGDGIHVRELAEKLSIHGHEVRLVAETHSTSRNWSISLSQRPESTVGQVRLASRLARGWADVIYERRTSPKVAWSVSLMTGLPFVIELNGIVGDEPRSTGGQHAPRDSMIRNAIRARMMRKASRVIAVSEGIRTTLISTYGLDANQVSIVPNGANTSIFRPLDKSECRRQLGYSETERVICYAGNLVHWQGVQHFLQALVRLTRAKPDVKGLILGEGPDENRLKAMAENLGLSEAVRFVGAIPYERVPVFLGAADVCVAPFEESRKASPIKIFEYLACGKPVVASDIDEVGVFLRETRTGIAVPPSDSAKLEDAIKWILDHPEQLSAMGTRGTEVVRSTRSWDLTAERVIGLLDSITTSSRRTGPGGQSGSGSGANHDSTSCLADSPQLKTASITDRSGMKAPKS